MFHPLLFERFDKLKQPSFHPKWKEINLTARVPGWNRYSVADEVPAATAAKDQVAARPAGAIEAAAGRSDVDTTALTNSPLFQEFLKWRQKNQKNQ